MRRIGRHVLDAVAALSLLLCLATAGLWARTYFAADDLAYHRGLPGAHGMAYHFRTARGEVGAIVMEESFWPMAGGSEWIHRSEPAQSVPLAARFGRFGFYAFGWHERRWINGQAWIVDERGIAVFPAMAGYPQPHAVFVPLWFVMALLALPPMSAWLLGWRRRRGLRRQRAGLCGRCGYDLRATPEDQSRYPLNYASRIGADRGH